MKVPPAQVIANSPLILHDRRRLSIQIAPCSAAVSCDIRPRLAVSSQPREDRHERCQHRATRRPHGAVPAGLRGAVDGDGQRALGWGRPQRADRARRRRDPCRHRVQQHPPRGHDGDAGGPRGFRARLQPDRRADRGAGRPRAPAGRPVQPGRRDPCDRRRAVRRGDRGADRAGSRGGPAAGSAARTGWTRCSRPSTR